MIKMVSKKIQLIGVLSLLTVIVVLSVLLLSSTNEPAVVSQNNTTGLPIFVSENATNNEIFAKIFRERLQYYEPIRDELVKAEISLLPENYTSTTIPVELSFTFPNATINEAFERLVVNVITSELDYVVSVQVFREDFKFTILMEVPIDG